MTAAVLPEFLTRPEAAELARVSIETLRRWHARGFPLGRVRRGGRVLFVRDALEKFLKTGGGADVRTPAAAR